MKFGSEYQPVLLVITISSVIFLGLLEWASVYRTADPSLPFYLVVPATYVAGLGFIFGVAQLGYAALARLYHTQAPRVYLIPGIPGITYFFPTLGTALRPREPPVNADAWFDFNFVGPLFIFLGSVGLNLFAIGTRVFAVSLPSTGAVSENLAQVAINYVSPSTPSFFSPLVDVATIGFGLVFLSLLPSFPYNGGNLVSAVFGPDKLKPLSYVGALALMLIDTPYYFAIALLLVVFASHAKPVEVLDGVSPISKARRILLVCALLLMLVSVPIPNNVATLQLPWQSHH